MYGRDEAKKKERVEKHDEMGEVRDKIAKKESELYDRWNAPPPSRMAVESLLARTSRDE